MSRSPRAMDENSFSLIWCQLEKINLKIVFQLEMVQWISQRDIMKVLVYYQDIEENLIRFQIFWTAVQQIFWSSSARFTKANVSPMSRNGSINLSLYAFISMKHLHYMQWQFGSNKRINWRSLFSINCRCLKHTRQ